MGSGLDGCRKYNFPICLQTVWIGLAIINFLYGAEHSDNHQDLTPEVYLRLADITPQRINLVIEPARTEGISDDLITILRNIETIIKNDLEYSLYFRILSDTLSLLDFDRQGVLLRVNLKFDTQDNLEITLEDFKSKNEISIRRYKIENKLRKLSHSISDDIIETLTGEKGIAQTKIAFSYKTRDGKALAIIDYDGYNFQTIVKNKTFNLFPCWAPDGKRILFSSYKNYRLNIYILDLIKNKISLVSSFRRLNFAPCWSPDAKKIALALTKDGNAEIYLLDLMTKKLLRLTNNYGIDVSPTFSPNSREIAFVSDRSGSPQIYIMDIHGGNLRRLTFHGDYNTSPAWSPCGNMIAYVSREADNSQQIYVTDPYDFYPIRLTEVGNNEEPSWSADGLHIVFSSNRNGKYQLFTMNWDGTRQHKLTDGIIANAPDWSPNR